ncbi:hypothetical protein NF865_09285 [Thermococcus aggregans]|uniref:Uncharacterized protein n=1 Tax=Thermococcus aggregans TaxID=110163 RepID=A0A9E7SNM6_THEAG|nr:hypothetical protein [Thermococcus aggregans]USS40480.1 hypothetical protein NF865_09285 [Thermococcus aggregans]
MQDTLKEVETFISGIHFLPKTDIDRLAELYRTLSFPNHAGRVGYRPDYIILTANVVGKQRLEVVSEEPIKKNFELPILRLGKIVLVEVKSGKTRRLTFTANQKKFLKSLPEGIPAEFLLLFVEIGDVVSLKEVNVSVYRVSDIYKAQATKQSKLPLS